MNFTDFLQQKNIIPSTIQRHEREINKYTTWLKTLDKYDLQATTKDLLDYLQYIKENRNLSNATQNQLLQILKNYYQYLSIKHEIKNITHFIKIRGTKKIQLQTHINNETITMLCDAYYDYIKNYQATNKELRFYPNQKHLLLGYYITLTLISYQALTINEILSIQKDSFDIRKGTIYIQSHLKGNARTLSLESSQIGSIIEFYSYDNEALLMPNKNHFEKLNTTLKTFLPIYKDFRQLRSSKITTWIKEYGLRKAQILAGHKNIQSTEKYIANDIETLQTDMKSYHPIQ